LIHKICFRTGDPL